MYLLVSSGTITLRREAGHRAGKWARLTLIAHYSRIRWYNPKLEDFEWRKEPETDEEAFQELDGSPYASRCTRTYQEWRNPGAPITAALIRAGEAAKEGRIEEDGR
jgi:hypothetical protein